MTLPQHAPAEQRAFPRHPVMWSGTVATGNDYDWYVLNCQIRNFSISGVHILVEKAMEVGREITLRIRSVGEFRGTVVWAEGNRLGVQFDESPERVAELIQEKL